MSIHTCLERPLGLLSLIHLSLLVYRYHWLPISVLPILFYSFASDKFSSVRFLKYLVDFRLTNEESFVIVRCSSYSATRSLIRRSTFLSKIFNFSLSSTTFCSHILEMDAENSRCTLLSVGSITDNNVKIKYSAPDPQNIYWKL